MSDTIGRLTIRDGGDVLTMDNMFPTVEPRDITAAVLQLFFPKIPSGSEVKKCSMCVVGDQGCGKSVLLESLSAEANRRYGADRVHTIYTDDVRVAMDLLDDRPVQLVIVDDAMTWASSRQISQQTAIIKTYNQSRHVYERKLNGRPGLILYIWAWQRFKELDPSFRQSDVMIFKTGISEPGEAALIERFIGPRHMKELNDIWYQMKQGNNSIKSRSIARISSQDVARGTGIMDVPWTQNPHFPKIVSHEEHFSDKDTEMDILENYAEKPEWALRIEIYRLKEENPDLTQAEIATIIGDRRGTPVRQGYVSESLARVKELITSK